jgi:CheY-like chemotaxis protein
MEFIMPTKMKGVCPKCKIRFTFDADKITAGTVKCKCPGCASVLHIKKPGSHKEKPAAKQPQPESGMNMHGPGGETAGKEKKLDTGPGLATAGKSVDHPKAGDGAAPGPAEKEQPPDQEGEGGPTAGQVEEERAGESKSREFKRVKFKKKVLVNNQIMVEALDISENGLFLHTGRSFEDGAIVEVGIPTLPGNFDLKVNAMVRHNHRGIGMGLQFVDLDEEQELQLRKLISELDDAASQELDGRKKILLVGGTATARNINKSKLVLDGYYVLQATTPAEVFQILDNEPPDAMTLEWQEPAFNCRGLLAQIKEKPQYDGIIRVVLSALTDVSVQRDIIAAGAHRCMAKMDTNPARLSQVLKQLIAERDG